MKDICIIFIVEKYNGYQFIYIIRQPRFVLLSKSKVSLEMYVFSLLLKVSIFSNEQIVFGKFLYKWGAHYLKHLLVKPGPGTLCSTSFHVSWIFRNLKVDDSLSSSISFKSRCISQKKSLKSIPNIVYTTLNG